jgi:hypothetical protein
MQQMPDSALIRATIVMGTICYAAAEWLRLLRPAAWRVSRGVWTVGALSLVVHAAAAFHYRYGWSHTYAIEATAADTAAVTGFEWGGGLYINYAFVALWTADAAWWWLGAASYAARRRALSVTVSAIFLFMFLNGVVVFADGPMRWFGAVCVLIVCLASRQSAVFSLQSPVFSRQSTIRNPPKPDARSPRPDARSPRPEARSPRPEARSPRPEARSPRPEVRGAEARGRG